MATAPAPLVRKIHFNSLPRDEQFQLRRAAVRQVIDEGMSRRAVARYWGVTRQAVAEWVSDFREVGEAALVTEICGRERKLTKEHFPRLIELLNEGPREAGVDSDLWTLATVAKAIKRHFGVEYQRSAVSELLATIGFTSQRPERRARERNEEEIERWKREEWPEIKKGH